MLVRCLLRRLLGLRGSHFYDFLCPFRVAGGGMVRFHLCKSMMSKSSFDHSITSPPDLRKLDDPKA